MPGDSPKPALKAGSRHRRRHARYRAEFLVDVVYFSGNQHQALEGHCRDLSESGMGVLLAAEMKIADVATLRFTLPGAEHGLEVRAVVRYRCGYQYGFEFLSLNAEQRTVLHAHLRHLQPIE